jgi:hypothetical protein
MKLGGLTVTATKRLWLGALLALALFGWAEPAQADFISYSFSADTSSVSGQAGSLDFQFNPLDFGGSDTAVISSFSSVGGILGAGTPTGDVTGDLTNLPVTFTDDQLLNDLTHDFTFGTSLLFTVTLNTNSSSPGAAFTFTMYDGSGNPVDAIPGGNPSAIEIDVDAGGHQEAPQLGDGMTAVPEPASLALLSMGTFVLAAWKCRRRKPVPV